MFLAYTAREQLVDYSVFIITFFLRYLTPPPGLMSLHINLSSNRKFRVQL